jgi:RNA polymerase sigma-70 factor (ECF subfamily)
VTQTLHPKLDVEGLALAASLGDPDALTALVRHFHVPLTRYLRVLTQNNLSLADDLAGATWEKVAGAIRDYRMKGAGFEAWLFTIARRCLAAHFRWVGRHPERLDGEMIAADVPDWSADPDAILANKIESHQIAAAVNELPRSQRRCVILRFVVGLSLAETAATLDKNVNTVKQLQYRALRALKKLIGDLPSEPDPFPRGGSSVPINALPLTVDTSTIETEQAS